METMDSESKENVDTTGDKIDTKITDLDCGCLIRIFSHLSLWDLVNVGEIKSFEVAARLSAIRFKKFSLYDYVVQTQMLKRPLQLDKVLSYIAPYVEHLSTLPRNTEYGMRYYNVARHRYDRAFIRFNFPKLRSLKVEESAHLEWITDKTNVKKLKIYKVDRSHLNNFAKEMTNLTDVYLGYVSEQVPSSELSQLIENNRNIVSLQIDSEYERELPQDFFTKLPHLKRVGLWIGKNLQNLKKISKMQPLTNLTLGFTKYNNNIYEIEWFLKNLAQRKTVRTIRLKKFYTTRFEQESHRIFRILQTMNLTSFSMELKRDVPQFCHKLAKTPFHHLKVLQLRLLIDAQDIFVLIESFRSLECLIVDKIRNPNFKVFLVSLYKFLKVKKRNRPSLLLHFGEDRVRVIENTFTKLLNSQ